MEDHIHDLGHDRLGVQDQDHQDAVQDRDQDQRETEVQEEVEDVTLAVDHLDPDHAVVHLEVALVAGHQCPTENDMLETE